jgi:erythromycin esterase-like protein
MRKENHRQRDAIAGVRAAAQPVGDEGGLRHILDMIGGASLVLIGEASHGTHDFYEMRCRITRALIEERGFSAVAIEGDWPDAYRVNRFVQSAGDALDAAGALDGFERFPTWMWRNTAVAAFVSWLRERNAAVAGPGGRAGFYGLDLYSLHASMRAVIAYLDQHDPVAARAARRSYACFEEFGHATDIYAWAASRAGGGDLCEDAVTRELLALREKRGEFLQRDGLAASDEFFYALQNARLARNAERYYRTMFRGRIASWNVRDRHMAETLEELLMHLRARGQPQKVVVWAHNSHLGDARATEIGDEGELNLGQLVRERHEDGARLIGFTTYAGTVMAASDWGGPAQLKQVRPALAGSFEDLFHQTGAGRFFLDIRPGSAVHELLKEPRLERAIGVIYRPETERFSHYFNARLADQFDAVIHFDETHGVQPLERVQAWEEDEVPETFPSGV